MAWLQQQTGSPAKPPLFLQFTRAQLRELILVTEDQPVFFWVNRPAEPLAWNDGLLVGVSEHLEEPELPAGPAAAQPDPPRILRPKPGIPGTATPLQVDGSEHYLALSLPSFEHPTRDEALELVKRHGFMLETSNRKWWLRDRHKTLNFLATHWASLREHYGAQFTPNFERNTARLQLAEVTCAAVEAGDGYDVTLALRAGQASEEAVRAALAGGRGYVEEAGNLVLLPTAMLDRLAQAQSWFALKRSARGCRSRIEKRSSHNCPMFQHARNGH